MCTYIRNVSHRIVTNLANTTFSEDTIIVTWTVANSPNCGAGYYSVMISPDEHSNATMNVTELTATFSDLMSDTDYTITVTPYCRMVAGNNDMIVRRTSPPEPTQSINPTNQSNTPGTYVSLKCTTIHV